MDKMKKISSYFKNVANGTSSSSTSFEENIDDSNRWIDEANDDTVSQISDRDVDNHAEGLESNDASEMDIPTDVDIGGSKVNHDIVIRSADGPP